MTYLNGRADSGENICFRYVTRSRTDIIHYYFPVMPCLELYIYIYIYIYIHIYILPITVSNLYHREGTTSYRESKDRKWKRKNQENASWVVRFQCGRLPFHHTNLASTGGNRFVDRGMGKPSQKRWKGIRNLTGRFVFFSQEPHSLYTLSFYKIWSSCCPWLGIFVLTFSTPHLTLWSLNDKWRQKK
jgi:hypothetical protein